MEDQFDALLYLGTPSDIAMSLLSKRLCSDLDYLNMRVQRMTWAGMQRQVDRLRQYCAAVP